MILVTPSSSPHNSYPSLPTSEEELLNSLNDIRLDHFKTVIEIVFKKAQERANAPLLTCGTASTEDVFSDISFFFRIFMPEHAATQAAGFPTAVNAFQGWFAAVPAAERFALAKSTGDRSGMIEAAIDYARGYYQAVGGAAYAGDRGTRIAADIHKIDTSSLQAATPLGRAAYVLGLIGNIAFMAFYMLLGIWGSYGSVKDWQFSRRMDAQENDKLFDFLMGKVSADPKTKLVKLNNHWNLTGDVEKRREQLAAFKNKLVETALSRFTNQFLKWQGELKLEGKSLTKQELKNMFEILFEAKEAEFKDNGVYKAALSALDLTEDDVEGFGFTTLELMGFNFEQGRRRAKKEAKFARVADLNCVKAVQKLGNQGLALRLVSDDPLVKASAEKKLDELKGNIDSANTKNKWIHGVMIPIAILGITSTVLGFFPLSAVMSIVLITVTVLLALTMMGTDGFFMWNGWKQGGAPGQYDKLYLALVSLVLVTAMAVSVGLTLGFGLALMPMYMSLGIGAASLSLSGYAYYKIDQKKKAWDENHPSLGKFQALLDAQTQNLVMDENEKVDQTVPDLFKKLPKEDRLAIRKKYGDMSKNNEETFKQGKYIKLDTTHEFGREYIWNVISGNFGGKNEKEYELLTLGMKKTVKFFWERWAQTKSMENKELALKLQSLFERVSQRQLDQEDDRFNFERKLWELDPHVIEKLTNDIWYVVKRQESLGDLKTVVESVIDDKQTITGLVQNEELKKPTRSIQHMHQIFQQVQHAVA
jgi:hypothetical protein